MSVKLDGYTYLSTNDNGAIDICAAATISFWVTLESSEASGLIGKLNKYDWYSDSEWEVYIYGNKLRVVLYNNATSTHQTVFGPDISSWVGIQKHVVITWDGVNIKIYVNGSLIQTETQTAFPIHTSTPLKIGTRGAYGWNMRGELADIILISRALTDDEVAQLYEGTFQPDSIAEHWPLETGPWGARGNKLHFSGNEPIFTTTPLETGVILENHGVIRAPSTFDMSEGGTVSLWITGPIRNDKAIISCTGVHSFSSENAWEISTHNHKLYIVLYNSPNSQIYNDVAIPDLDNWYHLITVAWDSDNLIYYLDGREQGRVTTSVLPKYDTRAYINVNARDRSDTWPYNTKQFKDIVLYGRALSAAEVNSLYNGIVIPNFLEYWPLTTNLTGHNGTNLILDHGTMRFKLSVA